LLSEGFNVTVLDNLRYGSASLLGVIGQPGFRFVKGDIRDPDEVKDALTEVDSVVHLAALVGESVCNNEPEEAVSVNLEGTKHMVDLARGSGVTHFIFFSTCSAYGVQDTTKLANEGFPMKPVSLYARTKIDAEEYLFEQVGDRFYCTVFRPSTVYGVSPRMRFDLIPNHFIKDAYLTGDLTVYGGQMWRPLMWVGDGGRAIVAALNAPINTIKNETFNLGDMGANHRKSEVAQIIKDRILPNINLVDVKHDSDLRSYRVDFSKIESQLGFKLSRSLEEGMSDVLTVLQDGIISDYDDPKYYN
jgi:nucleoside-diphosphate-sugar epimerase